MMRQAGVGNAMGPARARYMDRITSNRPGRQHVHRGGYPSRSRLGLTSWSGAWRLQFLEAQLSNSVAASVAARLACCILFLPLFVVSACACLGQGIARQDPVGPIVKALQARDFSGALRLSHSALQAHPGDCRIWTLHGMATQGAGNLSVALADYQHALKLVPSYLPALEGAAQADFQLGHASARSYLVKILAQRRDDPRAHALLGILDYREQNCAAANAHFEKATEFLSGQPKALTEYGVCLHAVDRDSDSVAVFRKVLALDPANHEARYNLALAQRNAREPDEALETLRPLVAAPHPDPGALVLSADLYESKNDTAQAVKLLREALIADAKDMDAYTQFASVSFDHASPQVGIDILDFGLKNLPREPRLYLLRGILLTQLGEFARAADDFDAASRIDPSLQFLGVAQGIVKAQQHNQPEALAKFRAAVKAHPEEAYSHYLLAEALQEEGKPEGSPEYLEEIAEARKAVKLDPGLVAAHDLLASAYYQQGHFELAIQESRAALVKDPDDKQALYHLLLSLRKTGSKAEVETLVKRLAALQANSNGAQRFQKPYRLYEGTAPGNSPAQ